MDHPATGDAPWSVAPPGLGTFSSNSSSHGLRRGLLSAAAPRLSRPHDCLKLTLMGRKPRGTASE
jgi:hypothetical protein